MAVVEVRVAAEGELRFMQASGFTGAFTTASAPATGLLGFAEELRATYPMPELIWARDRGVLSHPKRTNDGGPYGWEFRFAMVNTAALWWINQAGVYATASGASVRKVHLEYKMGVPEHGTGAGTGIYWQLHHAVLRNWDLDEGDPTMVRMRWEGWSAGGGTATSYLGV